MKCNDLIRLLEEEVPLEAAESWDNPGFLVGDREREVKKIMVVLDITNEVVEEAVRTGTDFILAHHPVIFSKIKKCTSDDFLQRKLLKLIENKICCYGMHTNYDACRMCDAVAEKLGFYPDQVLEEAEDPRFRAEGKGIGMIGAFAGEKELKDFAGEIKRAFGIPDVSVFGNLEEKVHKAAIVPGSGRSMARLAAAKGADVLVTGDIGHHEGLDAVDMGLCVIDAGHYGLEQVFIDDMKELLEQKLPDCDIISCKTGSPFQVI